MFMLSPGKLRLQLTYVQQLFHTIIIACELTQTWPALSESTLSWSEQIIFLHISQHASPDISKELDYERSGRHWPVVHGYRFVMTLVDWNSMGRVIGPVGKDISHKRSRSFLVNVHSSWSIWLESGLVPLRQGEISSSMAPLVPFSLKVTLWIQ